MTLCNLVAQQPGGPAVSPGKNKTFEAPKKTQENAEEVLTPQDATDNNRPANRDIGNNKEKLKFSEELRKKVGPEKPEETPDEVSDGQTENEENAAPVPAEANYQNTTIPICTINYSVPPQKDVDASQIGDVSNPMVDPKPPHLKTAVVSPAEAASGNHSPEGPLESIKNPVAEAAPATDAPANTEITTKTVTIPETAMAPAAAPAPDHTEPKNHQIVFEPTPKIAVEDKSSAAMPEQAAVTSKPTASNLPVTENTPAAPASPVVEDAPTPSDQTVEHRITGNPMPENAFKGLMEKASNPQPQQNIPADKQDRPQGIPQNPMPGQTGDIQDDVLTAQSSIHKMNVSADKISVFQAEKQQNMPINHDFKTIKVTGDQVSTEPLDASAVTEKTPIPPASSKAVENISSAPGLGLGRQIQESVSSSYRPGTQQIVIQLDPADLGRVTIKFTEHRDGITGILHVDKSQTRDQIQQTLPEIVQNLQNSDIQIKKLNVVLSNQQQHTASGEQSAGHHSGFGQQNPHHPNSLENTASYNEWLAGSNPPRESTEPPMQLTDDSINMLI